MATQKGSGFAPCAQAIAFYHTIALAFRYLFRLAFIPQKTEIPPVAHSPPFYFQLGHEWLSVRLGAPPSVFVDRFAVARIRVGILSSLTQTYLTRVHFPLA